MSNSISENTKLNEHGKSTTNPEEITKKKKFLKFFSNPKENRTDFFIELATTFGIAAVIVASLMPFIIKYFFLGDANYKTYSSLGPIGDYIGGTTVAVLTAASVFLLLATIIMQRKEIKISQQGIDELVKQTAASIEQAEEARKEVTITNETMARQQFETTFFNIINLHQNLGERVKRSLGERGSNIFHFGLKDINMRYDKKMNAEFKKLLINAESYHEINELMEYLEYQVPHLVADINLNNRDKVLERFNHLDFVYLTSVIENYKLVRQFEDYAYSWIKEEDIQEIYSEFINQNKTEYKNYIDSFNTIINFLKESSFEKADKKAGAQTNKIYREIFFTQLSPEELMFMYYYAKYNHENDWLMEELKTYNLFYPNLDESLLVFKKIDIKNIEALHI